LAIDNRELDFWGSEAFGQMLLGEELKLGNKLWQVIIPPINGLTITLYIFSLAYDNSIKTFTEPKKK
jgi:hypothetical protein